MHISAIVHISMFEPLYRVSTNLISQGGIRSDVEAQTQCRLQSCSYLKLGGSNVVEPVKSAKAFLLDSSHGRNELLRQPVR